MSIALASLTVTAGKTFPYTVGARATVGAVVVLNESPYGLNVSNGASSQWIAAQTADLVPCDSMGFNGNLTITTDGYLSNAGSAPSFLVLFTAYAPGEPIRGTYPSPLARLTNGGNVGIASQLVNDGNAAGTQIIEATPSGASSSAVTVTNDGAATFTKSVTTGTMSLTGAAAEVGGQATAGSFGVPMIVAVQPLVAVMSTAGQTIVSFVPSVSGLYRISPRFTLSNGTSGNAITLLLQWTEGGYNNVTSYFAYLSSTGIVLLNGTNSLANAPYAVLPLTVYASGGSSLNVQFTDPTHTPNDDVSAIIERLA